MAGTTPKRWSVQVFSRGDEPLSVRIGDKPFDQGAPGRLGPASPVEYLLISIASCFALSCRMALAQRQLVAASFSLNVLGTKAAEAPSHLRCIELELVLPGELHAHADAVAAHAKGLCTVTNTMAAAVPLQLFVRTEQ